MRFKTFIANHLSIRYIFIGTIFLFPVLGLGQEARSVDSIVQTPHALQSNEIGTYDQKTRQLVTDVRKLMENSTELELIRETLIEDDSVLIEELNSLRDTLNRFSLDQLDKIENDLNIYEDKIEPWTETVERWRAETDQYKKAIGFDIQVWNMTADSVRLETKNIEEADTTALATLNRIEDQLVNNIERLSNLGEEFDEWERSLLDTENALTLTQSEINDASEIITEKKQKFIDNIWIPEYPPIWKQDTEGLQETYVDGIKSRYEQVLRRIKRFSRDNTDFYTRLIFSFIVLLSLILYMRKRVSTLFKNHPQIAVEDNVVLKYPVLSAFVIFIYSFFILFQVPAQIKYLVLTIAIIPLSILLWELKSTIKLRYVVFFVVFALIFVYLSVFSEAIKQLRFTMIIIDGLCIYFLISIRKDKELISRENPYWLGTLPTLIPVFLFLGVLAIIANIIGSIQLSLVLTRTIVGTFLAYIVIKESVSLIESFIYLLIAGPLFRVSNIVKEDSSKVLRWLNKMLRIASYIYWLYIVLGLLKVRETLFTSAMDFITAPLEVGELSISLGDVLIFYIILQISTWISRFIRYFLDKEIYPRTHMDKGVASTISLMIRYTFAFLGFILALAAAGVNLNQVVVGISALGIGIGFGLQNIVNNFVSGIILALERPITIGDIVKVDDVEGIVKDIGLRASQIRTWEGADVLVPNGSLISGKLMNWTFTDRARRLNVEVRLPLEADVEKALKIMLNTAKSMKELSKNPGPAVNYEGNIEGRSVIRVYGWIDDLSNGWGTGTAFRIAVYKALRKEGFNITMPVLDVQIDPKPLNNPPLPGS